MSERDEFIELLVRLILDGLLTEEEANLLLDEYDRTGELPLGWQLPLPLIEAILEITPEQLRAYELPANAGELGIETLQTRFMGDVARLGASFGQFELTLREWQEQLRDRLIEYLATSALLGNDGQLTPESEEGVAQVMFVQMAYLARFADNIATGELSEAQIVARSKLYAGEGRGLFYSEQEQGSIDLYGYVVDYIAVDDRATCSPCRNAEESGPYLPGEGPFPGRVCLGRGYCRCRRTLRYDPPAYLRLTGNSA